MGRIAKVKVVPATEQRQLLKDTLVRASKAALEVSRVAGEATCFRLFVLPELVYAELRQGYGLSAQMTVRVIGKVAAAYRAGKKRERRFRKPGGCPCDSRILSWLLEEGGIAIRERVRGRKAERGQHNSWAFAGFGKQIAMQARRAGLPVIAVDPRHTSRTSWASGWTACS